MNPSHPSRNRPIPPSPYVPAVQYQQPPLHSQITYAAPLPNIQSSVGNPAYDHQAAYPYQPIYSSPSSSFQSFPYDLQQPYGAPLPSTFGAPNNLLVPDLNRSTQPLLDLPPFILDPNFHFFPPIPQSTPHPSAGSPHVNSQDIASGISPLYQAPALLTPPLHMPDHTYLPQISEFDFVLAKARDWMENNPGQKVKSDGLEGAYRQVHKYSWECLGCGETRKRREQIAHHIRGTHLLNRGFYHCDEPGCSIATNTAGDLKRHKETHIGNRPHRCHFCRKGLSRSDNVNRHEDKCPYNPVNNHLPLSLPSQHNLRQSSNATTSTAVAPTTPTSTRRSIAAPSSVRANQTPSSPPRTRSLLRSSVRRSGPSGPSPAMKANIIPHPLAGLSSSSPTTIPTPLALRTLPIRHARNRAHPYFSPSHT